MKFSSLSPLIDFHNQFVVSFLKAIYVPKKTRHLGVKLEFSCDARGEGKPKLVPVTFWDLMRHK
ncbi:MAG: hypothetical protein CME70_03680 [Halobacteriovorax sp.]|nr:hypothetical protein [Halobacteriovorax sp.]